MGSDRQSDVVSFGPFRLYPRHRKLLCRGVEVRLGGRAMDVLMVLARNKGIIVHSDELFSAAWSGVFVHESNLKVTVAGLRRTLREHAPAHDFIKNVVGRGYWLNTDPRRASSPGQSSQPAPLPQLGTIIGRDDDISALCETMTNHRLTTIVGAGGMGKTTVAVAAAQMFEDETGHTVIFVDLSRVGSQEFVASTIVAGLGINLQGGDILTATASIFSRRNALLLLDTCEHVQSEVARICDILLANGGGLRVLATSRKVLGAQNEHVIWLPPLSVPPEDLSDTAEAVMAYAAPQLLTTLAAEKAGYCLDDGDAPAIAEICRRLDGAPLAIELVSSKLNGPGVKQVLGELEDRFRRLRKSTPGGPLRQQTLLLTLEWSYALLTSAEAQLLRAISIFSGTFTSKAISYIGAGLEFSSARIDSVVSGLHANSMLSIDSGMVEARYRLLDSTRAFSRDLLIAHGEFDRVAARHARLQLQIVAQVCAQQSEMDACDWQALCGNQINDLRAAIDWSLHRGGDVLLGGELVAKALPIWQTMSLDQDCARNCEAALRELECINCTDKALKLSLAVGLTIAYTHLAENPQKTIEMFESAIALARSISDATAELQSLGALAFYKLLSGNPAGAKPTLDAMYDAAIRTNDPFSLWEHQNIFTWWEATSGNMTSAHLRLQKVFDEMRDYPAQSITKERLNTQIMMRTGLGATAWYAGKPAVSRRIIDETAQMAESHGHGLTLAYCLCHGLIDIALQIGDYRHAEYRIALLERTIDRNGLGAWVGRAACYRACLEAFSGVTIKPEKLTAAFDGLGRLAPRVDHHSYLATLAWAMLDAEYIEEAETALEYIFAQPSQRWIRPELLRIKAGTERARGRKNVAEGTLRDALRDASEIEVGGFKLRVANDLASLLFERNALVEARGLFSLKYGELLGDFDSRDERVARDLLGLIGLGDVRPLNSTIVGGSCHDDMKGHGLGAASR